MVDVNINLNKVFSVVLHEEKTEAKDGTEPSVELEFETRNYRYPLTLNESFPAYIKFTAVEIEGVDFIESIKNAGLRVANSTADLIFGGTPRPDSTENNESEAGKELTEEERKSLTEDAQKKPTEESFYDAGQGEIVGSVTLPLQRSLQFQDNVQYNVANLGVSGSMAAVAAEGNNPFAGMMGGDGQVTRAVSSLTTAAVAKNALSLAGAAVGSKAGTPGAILGFSAAGDAGEGVGNLVRGASRVASNPNQRTLFEQVGMRDFSFTFKMIANNEKESQEIKNIVQFFREELYPEPITTSSGVQLAYEFPNMFDIEIKNFVGEAPAPKIQRCYLLGVQTNYNGTASTMHPDGNFVEVDITLNFKEITALNKKKVRDGGF